MMSQNEFKKNLIIEVAINSITHYIIYKKLDFKVYRDNSGNVEPARVQDGLVKILHLDSEAIPHIKHIGKELYKSGSLNDAFKKTEILYFTHSSAKQVLKTLCAVPELWISEPVKTFAFKSDPSLAFHRIPFDLCDTEQLTPNWDLFLANFTNIQALKIWVGSLFVENSDRSQYLWLYGKGGNGKSTLAKIISRVLGDFARQDQVPSKDDKYWTHGLLHTRLVILDDCNNYGFVKTGLFKSCTGMGKARVEKKFGDAYNADLDCKFLFTSNEKPMISNEIADQRRLIFCSAKNQEGFSYDPDFEKRLETELAAFISNCVLLYKSECGDGRPIPVDQTEALELGGVFNEEIESWLETNFEYDPNSYVDVSVFREMLSFTRLNDRRVYSFLEEQNIKRSTRIYNQKLVKTLKGLRQKVFAIKN